MLGSRSSMVLSVMRVVPLLPCKNSSLSPSIFLKEAIRSPSICGLVSIVGTESEPSCDGLTADHHFGLETPRAAAIFRRYWRVALMVNAIATFSAPKLATRLGGLLRHHISARRVESHSRSSIQLPLTVRAHRQIPVSPCRLFSAWAVASARNSAREGLIAGVSVSFGVVRVV